MRHLVTEILAFVLFVLPAIAAGIDGEWEGTVKGQDGNLMKLTYEFRAEGKVLHGTVGTHLGGGPISEGKITKDTISFVIDTGEYRIDTTGTVVGDKIYLVEKIGKETIKITLKRVQSKKLGRLPAAGSK